MGLGEIALDRELALALQDSPDLVRWLLGRTKFAPLAHAARLLREELADARRTPFWWKHWWCTIPEHGDSETDLFLVFEAQGMSDRFALHHYVSHEDLSEFVPAFAVDTAK
jgi:hypothetical protein